MNADWIAKRAVAAMLIELSSSPKPGNIDRCHDYEDIGFQEFLISTVAVYPVFRKAALGGYRMGQLLFEAVRSWQEFGLPGNTHFGSMALLIPLAMAAAGPVSASISASTSESLSRSAHSSSPSHGDLRDELCRVLESTTVEDSVDFYRAFQLSGARVAEVAEFSLKDADSVQELYLQEKTLLELMKLSSGHDLIAMEWSTSFARSFKLSERLVENVASYGRNLGVVRTYLEALSSQPDSLVQAKFGRKKAIEASARAGAVLVDWSLESIRSLDREFLDEDLNPGSTADIIAASIFIALIKGLIF
ncbi:MAG TPA: triphosphoribosyl-dephospho-CoA synthase [Methanotrichaceae archaeon]|nr:triphosphoribosyl-dephospho-CoA synthase [Methanotrichaceae archaeon]